MIDAFAAGRASLSGIFRALVHGIRSETAIYSIAVGARGGRGNWVGCVDGAGRGLGRSTRFRWVADKQRKESVAVDARQTSELLHVAPDADAVSDPQPAEGPVDFVRPTFVCSRCGAPMIIVQTFTRGQAIRAPPQYRGTP